MLERYVFFGAGCEIFAYLFRVCRRFGRLGICDRLMLNRALWLLPYVATVRDMPDRLGAWSTAYRCVQDWLYQCIFDRMIKRGQLELYA